MSVSRGCDVCGTSVQLVSADRIRQRVLCPMCRQWAANPERRRMAKNQEDDDDDSEGGAAKESAAGKKKAAPAKGDDKKKNILVYVLAGVGLLSCCCCSSIGVGVTVWQFTGPNLEGNWESKDAQGRADILILLQASGKGNYRRAGGLARNLTWKVVDSKSVEMETTGGGDRLWTNERKTRFTFTVEGNTLTLTPTTGPPNAVRFTKVN